ncbi:DUF6288 domain-containing protein [Rubritalea spongiae]|uniref:DUF6288 domain-containing protein n=1 Tax=Rubritalea spongiae TaxID=430797 RepID=A0ABW5DYG8_9BACT
MRLLILFLILPLFSNSAAGKIPDFTKGDTLAADSPHDWNLGATGAHGWVYCEKGGSAKSRQVLITKIAENSPASQQLAVDDIIIGLNGADFENDARISLAKAITEAEATDGKLSLKVWRKGTIDNIDLSLPVLGRYCPTAPFHCPKSQKIVDQGCAQIAQTIKNPDGRRRHVVVKSLNALALMASGDDQWMPQVKQVVDSLKSWKISDRDLHSWSSGWVNILMCEYYLRTGDHSVLPTIQRLSMQIAEGQSHVGTWGHRFAIPETGIAIGYGSMNQVGISLTISLLLAKEAGIEDAKINTAINKSQSFLGFYSEKGPIPYGDHHPFLKTHDDNGKASGAAVLFNLLNDQTATRYFSITSLASYGTERETGHTGNFFNMLWALLGISQLDESATGAWIQESAWLLDLARTHTGSFEFLGKPGAVRGEHSFAGWDCTGAYILSYAIPNRNLYLTGHKKSCLPALSPQQVASVIHDGRGWTPETGAVSYQARSIGELLKNLGSWSPVIRERAAMALKTKNPEEFITPLIKLTQSPSINEILGACAAWEQLGTAGAKGVPHLSELLKSDDYWVRVQAAEALAGIGAPAQKTIPELLSLITDEPMPGDNREYLRRYVGLALFDSRSGLVQKSIDTIDPELLSKVIRTLLHNEDGRARSSLKPILIKLPASQIKPLLPAIYQAVVQQAPSGVMFSDGVRLTGLEILARNRVAEGVPLCLDLIDIGRWGLTKRWKPCFTALQIYGANAKSELPMIKKFAEQLYNNPKYQISKPEHPSHNKKMVEHYHTLMAIIKEIEAAPPLSSPMLSIKTIGKELN